MSGKESQVTFRHNILGLEKKQKQEVSRELLHSVESNSKFLKPKCVLWHSETT